MDKIKIYIKSNNLESAIDELLKISSKEFQNEIILHSSRLSDLKEKERCNVIESKEYQIEINKIRLSLLKLIEVQNQSKKSHLPNNFSSNNTNIITATLVIFITILIVYHNYYSNKVDSIPPLKNPRLIYESYKLNSNFKPIFTKNNHVETELEIQKIIQGYSDDNSSLLFDVIIKNNSTKIISPNNFIYQWCFNDGCLLGTGTDPEILTPVAVYKINIPVDKKRIGTNKQVIYPPFKVKSNDLLCFRLQIYNGMKHRPNWDWDLFFKVDITYNKNKRLSLFPITSFRNIYRGEGNITPLDYTYVTGDKNWLIEKKQFPKKNIIDEHYCQQCFKREIWH